MQSSRGRKEKPEQEEKRKGRQQKKVKNRKVFATQMTKKRWEQVWCPSILRRLTKKKKKMERK